MARASSGGRTAAKTSTYDKNRPRTLYFHSSHHVLIHDVTFKDPPNHCMEMYSDYTEISFVNVLAPSSRAKDPSHNTDAVDIHGTPFYVHDSYFSTGDDNIAAHASDTLVEYCTFGKGHGASIGSLGDVHLKNITKDSCKNFVLENVNLNSKTWTCDKKKRAGGESLRFPAPQEFRGGCGRLRLLHRCARPDQGYGEARCFKMRCGPGGGSTGDGPASACLSLPTNPWTMGTRAQV